MKVQEAAYKLLAAEGHPLSSRELARMVLARGWVTSSSNDPVLSISSTIEKNIREEKYNRPRLVFVPTVSGRRIGLPAWRPEGLPAPPRSRKVSIDLPEGLINKIQLATQAKLAPSFEDTIVWLVERGLKSAAPEIRGSLLRQLDSLSGPDGPR